MAWALCDHCEKSVKEEDIKNIVDIDSQTELKVCFSCFNNKFNGQYVHGNKTHNDLINTHIQEILDCNRDKEKIKTALLCFACENDDYIRLQRKYKIKGNNINYGGCGNNNDFWSV